jgi:hypothetical protein
MYPTAIRPVPGNIAMARISAGCMLAPTFATNEVEADRSHTLTCCRCGKDKNEYDGRVIFAIKVAHCKRRKEEGTIEN